MRGEVVVKGMLGGRGSDEELDKVVDGVDLGGGWKRGVLEMVGEEGLKMEGEFGKVCLDSCEWDWF